MFMQNFIKLSAAVHKLSYSQRNEKLSDDAEDNTAIASTGSKNIKSGWNWATATVRVISI